MGSENMITQTPNSLCYNELIKSMELTKDYFEKVINGLADKMQAGFGHIDEKFGYSDKQFAKVDEQFIKIDKQFKNIDRHFKSINQRFKTIDQQFKSIDKQFKTIDQQFKSIDKQFKLIDQQFKKVDQRFNIIDGRFRGIDKQFKRVDERFTSIDAQLISAKQERNILSEHVDDLTIMTKMGFDDLSSRVSSNTHTIEILNHRTVQTNDRLSQVEITMTQEFASASLERTRFIRRFASHEQRIHLLEA